MDKKKIILDLIKKETKIYISLSRKWRYNISMQYNHNDIYSFWYRWSTVDTEKKSLENKIQSWYDNILNSVFNVFDN